MRPPLHPRYWYTPFEAAEVSDLEPLALQDSVVNLHVYTQQVNAPPAVNSPWNVLMSDVIGNKEDSSFSGMNANPSIVGHLTAAYYHVHGKSFTIPDNAPVTLTPGNGAYVYGEPVEIGTLADSAFDVHWIQISNMDNNGYYNVQLCNSDGSVIYGKTSAFRDNNFVQEGNLPIQIPPQPKSTVIYARLGVSTGNVAHTIAIKLFAHPYSDLT